MLFKRLIFIFLSFTACKKKTEGEAAPPTAAPNPISWRLEDFSDPIDPRWEWRTQILLKFPQVEFRREGPFRLKNADWSTWATSSAATGPIALKVSLPKGSDPTVLEAFAQRARGLTPTKTLRLHVESARAAPELGEAPRKHFFFSLKTEHRENPYKEACAYLDRWIRAEQVLLRAPRPEDSRIEVDCAFVPAQEKRNNENIELPPQIILSYFAVPYTDLSGAEFPLKSLDTEAGRSFFHSLKSP